MQLTLSDLVIPWLEEKKFPLRIFKSHEHLDLWYFDLDIPQRRRAVGVIVNDINPPYVVTMLTPSRQVGFYYPADPEFFNQLEKAINEIIEECKTMSL
jgi:hypothetical protein